VGTRSRSPTYATTSILFLYVGLIPDLAIARDRSTGWRRVLYAVLSLGLAGHLEAVEVAQPRVLHLSGLATPLVLSVHSVVSWDFAMAIVPGWHATIFAPYFVAGAIFSGFAMVLTMMIPVRRIFGLEEYITDYHFENMSRFLLLTSLIVSYAYASEYFIAWYGGVEPEADLVLDARVRSLLDVDLDDDHLQRGRAADLLVQAGAHPRADAVHRVGADQHRHVVRALRHHHLGPLARVQPGGVGRVHAELARADRRRGQLRLLRAVLPDLPEAFPVVGDRGGEGDRAPRPRARRGGALMPTLLGVFERPDQIAAAARRLRDRGYTDIETYSAGSVPGSGRRRDREAEPSAPVHADRRTHWRRHGLCADALDGQQLADHGRRQAVLVGDAVHDHRVRAHDPVRRADDGARRVFIFGKLPKFKLDAAYHPRFSAEDFGLAVRCQERDVAEIDGLLRDHHAMEVSLVEG
jgi:hypothetical protein